MALLLSKRTLDVHPLLLCFALPQTLSPSQVLIRKETTLRKARYTRSKTSRRELWAGKVKMIQKTRGMSYQYLKPSILTNEIQELFFDPEVDNPLPYQFYDIDQVRFSPIAARTSSYLR